MKEFQPKAGAGFQAARYELPDSLSEQLRLGEVTAAKVRPLAAVVAVPSELDKLGLQLQQDIARLRGEKLLPPWAVVAPKVPDKHTIPYIGDDGKYYYTLEALRQANEVHRASVHRLVSPITGKEYPANPKGSAQVRLDEHYPRRDKDWEYAKLFENFKKLK